ncbi:rod linker polypeptide CpcD [Calothrix sp. NIES-2100]|uniref:phycobilisome linker polypeptide n=1 Tax=Calothrix sp. NIES-2100 TaxID=1954172 RepID=UPI000B5E9AC8|nr:rod linker polypeptide CpcD [Calothrix sp. NIES-2100]
MASTIIAASGLSDYSSRRVKLEVTGGYQGMMRRGRYTITIPYSCLSQTIQSIHRLGGKITKITLPSAHPQALPIEFIQPLPQITQSNTLASPQKAEYRSPQPQSHEPQNTTDKYQEEKPPQQEKQSIPVFKSVEYTFTEEW